MFVRNSITPDVWIVLAIMIICAIGWVSCIVRVVQCDWQAPYKAEVIYSVSILTVVPAFVVGYMNIADGVVPAIAEENVDSE